MKKTDKSISYYQEVDNNFAGLYEALVAQGWFERIKKIMDEGDDVPQAIKDYGKYLIKRTQEAETIGSKHNFYTSLTSLLGYISKVRDGKP